MAVGLSPPGKLFPVSGVTLGVVSAGIRYQNRNDLLLIEVNEGTTAAAVFTQNKCCAAPVLVAQQHMQQAPVRALLINSGNANAVTGELGVNNAVGSCAAVAEQLGVDANQVLPFSTGVIGEQLNMTALYDGIKSVVSDMQEDNWLVAAEAIMTTDTVAKATSRRIEVDGQQITITGIAKGSGMICPNMATMLAYVATDAGIDQAVLESFTRRAVAASFNRITVDSDTSTNDALAVLATGRSSLQINAVDDAAAEPFYCALESVLIELATAIIRDGEGATKFVRINVTGAYSEKDARAVALSIAHSPLVKTALFASDPNWGRILMALGKSPIGRLDMSKVDINIGGVSLIEQGEPAQSYTESQGKAVFEQPEITITIDLNAGDVDDHVWTTDLSHDYVSINADYRS
ncbi:bifunctional glutamate N-acetyltransferase/amino-acid acetyltransferase ArgJ [Arenicella xantha]|uniref:Arginine biosynthesis bifunctional protein ArgJ n=1 Tax=Arenicella xantha TaxID=644221 RepID=A0A395JIC3_9GAMM|nr:bifunctional glutamate N-acetyltransferase/amino-acid acetyltransferase ArgJ [Arenicella xantha]RBP49877.1 glutamate N-acetyltransferase [Arenicella xantha]